jgi:hypothetical protein
MLTNRNKLSALGLGILLSTLSLCPALAAEDAKEDAKLARNSQQSVYAPCADSKKEINDKADKTDRTDNSPDTWYDRQSRIPGG